MFSIYTFKKKLNITLSLKERILGTIVNKQNIHVVYIYIYVNGLLVV